MSVARDQNNDEMLEILHSAAASQFSRRLINSAGHSGSTHSNGHWRPHPGESGVGESGMSAYESVTSAASGTEALAGDEGFPMSGMEAGGAFGTYLLYLRSRLLHLLTYCTSLLYLQRRAWEWAVEGWVQRMITSSISTSSTRSRTRR